MGRAKGVPRVVYRLLGDVVVAVHLVWIVFILGGLVLALKWPRAALAHLAALALTLVLNLGGWYCPLTDLENLVLNLDDPGSAYAGSFMAKHLLKIIYPDLEESLLRAGAVVWVGLNLIGYGLLWRRRKSG